MAEYIKDCRTREQKFQDLKWKINCKIQNGIQWCEQNKEILIVLTPIIITGVTTVTKVAGKNINLRKAENLKKLYVFDHSAGHYWHLRRKLTNKEWLEIARRKDAGEKIFDILDQMKVLK